jgi:hypothetical protein
MPLGAKINVTGTGPVTCRDQFGTKELIRADGTQH